MSWLVSELAETGMESLLGPGWMSAVRGSQFGQPEVRGIDERKQTTF